MTKTFWQGLTKEGTIHYLVQNKFSQAIDSNTLAYAVGDDTFIDKTEIKLTQIRNVIKWLSKGMTLTCQDCGTRNLEVRIISDFHAAGTLCPSCLNKRMERKW